MAFLHRAFRHRKGNYLRGVALIWDSHRNYVQAELVIPALGLPFASAAILTTKTFSWSLSKCWSGKPSIFTHPLCTAPLGGVVTGRDTRIARPSSGAPLTFFALSCRVAHPWLSSLGLDMPSGVVI